MFFDLGLSGAERAEGWMKTSGGGSPVDLDVFLAAEIKKKHFVLFSFWVLLPIFALFCSHFGVYSV